MFYVYSPRFSVFLDHLFTECNLFNTNLIPNHAKHCCSHIQDQPMVCLEQIKAFCQGLSWCTDNKSSLIVAILTE